MAVSKSKSAEKVGLLLVNLGSPDAPTPRAVRKYLFQFLHDYRVIELTRWIWCLVLHGIILRIRPSKSAKTYASIWGEEEAEAPLVRITRDQAAGLQKRLGKSVHVEIAMRYGNPSIASALDKFVESGITKVAVLPAYPQYAAATTASVYDGVHFALRKRRDMPELRFLRNYHLDKDYIAALAASIKDEMISMDWTPDKIIASFHGIPKEMVDRGDPYAKECHETTKALSKALGKRLGDKLMLTFQSRFGPKEWLTPYTDKTLEALPDQGVKNVLMITPGFSADCLETLEEIAMEGHEIFEEAGGQHYHMVPCLNSRDDHLDMLARVAKERLLAGWIS